MKIVVYNIAYGTGSPKGEARRLLTGHRYLAAPERPFRKIAAFLRAERPDAAGLIEADLGSPRTHGLNQPEALAEMLGMTPVYRRKYAPDSAWTKIPYWRSQGNAVLVRDSEPDAAAHFFPRGMKKLILCVKIRGIRLVLVLLALTSPVRAAQIEYLTELLKDFGGPLVLAGDFNTFRGDGELSGLCRTCGLISANRAHHPTYPAWEPVRELDYVLHSRHLELLRFEVPHLPFSDHLPVVAEFRDA